MSYTNETTYYGLPLPTGSDKSTFTDNNTAFQAVDAALHTAYEQSGAATEDIVAIKATVANLLQADINFQNDLDTEKGKIVNLQDKEVLQDTAIAAVKADSQDMITAYNESTATSAHAYSVGDYFIYNDVLYRATASIAIGATIVPDTNCTTTNVTSEIKVLNGEVLKGEVSITTTGSETWAEALTRLANLLDFSKVTSKSVLESSDRVYHVSKVVASNTVEFSECNAAAAEAQVRSITVSTTTSSFYISHAGSTYSFTNASAETVTADLVVKLIY